MAPPCLGTWRWVVSFTPKPLYPRGKHHPVTIGHEASCTPESVWTLCSIQKAFAQTTMSKALINGAPWKWIWPSCHWMSSRLDTLQLSVHNVINMACVQNCELKINLYVDYIFWRHACVKISRSMLSFVGCNFAVKRRSLCGYSWLAD
jgi:hypothetical protein